MNSSSLRNQHRRHPTVSFPRLPIDHHHSGDGKAPEWTVSPEWTLRCIIAITGTIAGASKNRYPLRPGTCADSLRGFKDTSNNEVISDWRRTRSRT